MHLVFGEHEDTVMSGKNASCGLQWKKNPNV